MKDRKNFISTCQCGWHKAFSNEDDFSKVLCSINYTDFFEYPDDDEFPYDSAHSLLCGSCHHFALALNKVMGYNAYIIQGNDKKGFHAFCQIYKGKN